jgi:hypothetical protein
MRGSKHLQSIPVGVGGFLSDQQLLVIVLCCVVLLELMLLLLHLLMTVDLLLDEGQEALGHLDVATVWH